MKLGSIPLLACILLPLGFLSAPASAQANPGGQFDPAQIQQFILDSIKERLASSDDEFKLLEPRLQKILRLQFDLVGGMMRFGRGPGPDLNAGQPPSELQKARAALQEALDRNSTSELIKSRLAAYREARASARAELTKAQDDLRDLLTARQEATLVSMGMLE